MATDKNGAEIKEGDTVLVECRVVGAYDGQGFSVAILEPSIDCGGSVQTRTFGLNSRQLELKASLPQKTPKAANSANEREGGK